MLKIDYKFKDVSLRQKAMTHSSYANEHHGTHLDKQTEQLGLRAFVWNIERTV